LREKYRPHGGPNGGDGGDGGNAYIVGDSSINTLLHLKYNSTMYVERGSHGKGKGQRGRNGEDTYIKVPLGTVVWTMHKGGEKDFLTDVTDEIPRLVAQGGAGGWGNAHYVSPTNQEPLLSQRGERGDYVVLFLELKLLADVGLLARPNAGKSTLISRCSAAKPRIADYPFTTVEPILGMVNRGDDDFVMMEVPGLLEGAHDGVGLGHQFLRHAERSRVYLHLIDGLSPDPVKDFHMINNELMQFDPRMADKPQVLAVTKMDVTDVRERREELEFVLKEELEDSLVESPRIFFISAVSGEGIEELLGHLFQLLKTVPREVPLPEPAAAMAGTRTEAGFATGKSSAADIESFPTRQRGRRGNRFYMDKGVFVIESEDLERLTFNADLRDYRVLLQLWREMNRLGIARRFQDAGIVPGNIIRIGRTEMEWF
jgi:GTP-binding protein